VSATSIECGPPSLDRSNFFLSTCTFSQSRLTAAATEERRRSEESALAGIDGSIVTVVSEGRLAALCLRESKPTSMGLGTPNRQIGEEEIAETVVQKSMVSSSWEKVMPGHDGLSCEQRA